MALIKGRHAVLEALKSGRHIDRLVMLSQHRSKSSYVPLLRLARTRNIPVEFQSSQQFDSLDVEGHSQGVIAFGGGIEYQDLSLLLDRHEQFPLVVALDHLEDPYNFGAIMRTCELLGVRAVIFPKMRQCDVTPGVLKASSGAAFHLDLIQVRNIGNALRTLKKNGYWIFGTDVNQGTALETFDPPSPMVLVLGNEQKGISSVVTKEMDDALHISTRGTLDSLNVSVAAGIFLYKLSQDLLG